MSSLITLFTEWVDLACIFFYYFAAFIPQYMTHLWEKVEVATFSRNNENINKND